MAELRYVDWDGLVYYDGKIKEFIRDRAEDYLKMGGIVSIKDLPDPSWQNLNYIYKITDKFTSNDRFEKPGYIYPAGTWVQCVNSEDDERWLYIIFNEETIGGTADIDLSDYYTKSEVDKKIEEAIEGIDIPEVDLNNYYTKDEVDQLIPDDFATQSDIEVIDKAVAEAQASIDELQENKADKRDLTGLATEEFVLKKIAEAELADQDVDLSAYYTKSETEAVVKAAVDAIDIPDVSGLATKEELEAVQNVAGSNSVKLFQIDSDLVDINAKLDAIPTTYATKSELEEAIANIEHPTIDLSNYATIDSVDAVKDSVENVSATTLKQKYEVLPIEGMFIKYSESEIRLNTQRVVPTKQNVGETGNPNMFYATFRAFAPEGATQCKEGLNGNIDAEFSALATDKYGRKYTTIWAAIANTSDGVNWTKWGDNSTLDKYLGFYYHFHWYNEDKLIGTDKVRLILTNDSCHDDLVPDAVARRIDEKIKAIDLPDTSSFVTNEEFTTIQEQVTNIQNTYVTEEHLETNYVTNTTLEEKNYVTEQFVTNNYVTNETIQANYSTTEEIAQTYVTNTEVTEQIETKVTEVIQEKVDAGEIIVKADSISYDTW